MNIKFKGGKMKYLIIVLVVLTSCGYGNLEYVKENADDTFKSNGFIVSGYQGFTLGLVVPFTPYGGAFVWYTLERNGVIYEASLQRWGSEVHIYELRVKDVFQIKQLIKE
jgi:hypothetical protein